MGKPRMIGQFKPYTPNNRRYDRKQTQFPARGREQRKEQKREIIGNLRPGCIDANPGA